MSKRSILVVDDERKVLDYMVRGLATKYNVETVCSGEEAIDRVEDTPGRFQFAVIDQILGEGIDGIETCRRIADISQDIFSLVFTNVPTEGLEEFEQHREQAFCAGAHRYLERKSHSDALLDVDRFVLEMEQLARLQARIKDYYDERRHVSSLLTQLDLGVDIVDRSFKVWFMNEAMRRIINQPGSGLPRARCSAWHDYLFCPCPGCLVNKTFQTGEPKSRVFLSPVKRRGTGLFYLHVWTQAVVDEQGNIMLADDGKPLAVMETVQELNGTERLKVMSLDERLSIIALALHERLRPGYLPIRSFERVAIYAPDPGHPGDAALSLRALAGYDNCQTKLGAPFDSHVINRFDDIVKNARDSLYGYYSEESDRLDPVDGQPLRHCVYWPILDRSGKVVSLLRGSGDNCVLDDVSLMRPYAEELRTALLECQVRPEYAIEAETQKRLVEVDQRLQTISSPEVALRFLLMEACGFSGSYLGHIRERRDNQAVIVPLAPHSYDAYELVTAARWSLDLRASWSARAILSGTVQIRNSMSDTPQNLNSERDKLPEAAGRVLRDARSSCFQPLIFDGRCIGAMSFHCRQADNYKGDKLWFLREIARRAALVLRDYQAKRTSEERLESIQSDTVQLLLHNIHTPLGILRNEIDRVRSMKVKGHESVQKELAAIGELMDRACNRIGKLRDDFARLFRSHESEPKVVDVHDVLNECIADETTESPKMKLSRKFAPELRTLEIDVLALRCCVEVFLRNAIDEFKRLGPKHAHSMTITLRPAHAAEMARIGCSDPCLAVAVEDNGQGIPQKSRDTLFRIVRSSKSGGLGVGLANCRRMARAAGGEVYLAEDAYPGSRFIVLMRYRETQLGNKS